MTDATGHSSTFEMLVADGDQALAEQVMSVDAPETVTPPPGDIPPDGLAAAAGGGLAARMQARLEVIRQATTQEFPAPGWGGAVVMTVRMAKPSELATARSVSEFIAEFVTRIVVRDERDGEVVIDGFGPGLAELLGMPSGTPPAHLVRVLCADNDMWVAATANRMVEWMTGQALTDEATLGE